MELGVRITEAAAVPDATKVQIRASPRLQGAKDEHVLAKAERRITRKNLEFKEGKPSHSSLLFVTRDLVIDGLHQIGISLGDSFLEKDNNLCNLLGFIFGGGGGCDMGCSDQDWVDSHSEEEGFENLELKTLSSLCGDLVEEVFDETSFPLNSELVGAGRKGKSHAKSCLNKACKIRRVKSYRKRAR
jgi:hypothetical protein